MKQLTIGDLKRANVPQRFWLVQYCKIPDTAPYKPKVYKYLKELESFFDSGVGLFLWSNENSTGKTSIAVTILKMALRLGKTAYFEESGRLKNALIHKDEFEDNVLIENRIRNVDLLVLDDVGKEYRTESGFAENVLESVLRDRSQKMKLTILTSNLQPNKMETLYSADLAALLKETMIPLNIAGYDWRKAKAEELNKML